MPRVVIVSDREAWASMALEAVVAVHATPERVSWTAVEARALEGPMAAIVADVSELAAKLPLFHSWAARGWQPFTVVSLAPARGSAELAEQLALLGYAEPLLQLEGPEYWQELRATVELLLERHLWLVPEFVRATGCPDPPVVHAIAAAVRSQPDLRTVEGWVEVSDAENYTQLHELLVSRGLPRPKRMLSWIRLAWGVAYAGEIPGGRSRGEVASGLRYSSADYLGRWCRRLTGMPFGRLAESGVPEVMRRFRASWLDDSRD